MKVWKVFLAGGLALALIAPAAQAAVFPASQNFDGLSDAGTQTFDMLASGSTLTNSGSSNSGGGGLDFSTTWTDTRGETVGPVTAANDSSDFIGVNSFAGSNSPDVNPDNVAYSSGTQHNFEFNDGDGRLDLTFEAVDASAASGSVFVEFSTWFFDTGYETGDAFGATISDGGSPISLLSLDDNGIEAQASADDGSENWVDRSFQVDGLGLDMSNLILTISVDNNSGTENIFVDSVAFTPEPATLALLGLGGLALIRRRR